MKKLAKDYVRGVQRHLMLKGIYTVTMKHGRLLNAETGEEMPSGRYMNVWSDWQ